jgi:hypothetical protein
MSTAEVYWIGASGRKYRYWPKELPYYCDPEQKGNYIFARMVDGTWIPIYIGQGDIGVGVNDETHSWCAITKGATHVHVHTKRSEKDRILEKQDLLIAHPYVYEPTGCNQKNEA